MKNLPSSLVKPSLFWFSSIFMLLIPIIVEFVTHEQSYLIWGLYLLPALLITHTQGAKAGIVVFMLSNGLHISWEFLFQPIAPTESDRNIYISVVFGQLLVMFSVISTKSKLSSQKKELEKLNIELQSKTKWLEQVAYHDPLTGLSNRLALEEQFKEMLNGFLEDGKEMAVMYINLDRFHTVNDILGHSVGDYLLQQSAERIKNCASPEGIVVRHAGDEFVVMIPGISTDQALNKAKKMLDSFKKPFVVDEEEVIISLAIGLSFNSHCVKDIETMIRFANQALYQAKKKEEDRYALFNGEFFEKMDRKSYLEQGLKKAIDNDEMSLHYQPIVDLQTKEIVGVEALLRWNHALYGNITPFEFIPIAEETGLIIPIGQWVMEEACKQTKKWHEMGHSINVAVNVSLRQTWQKDFVENVRSTLSKTKLEAKYLKIEITESMMHNSVESQRILKELKQVGVSLSLDDFGTGYASLSMLGDLPFDYLKIDRSFIKDIPENARSRAITNTIIELGRSLDFVIIGEGIEEERHDDYLKNQGCHLGQGYLFSKPVPFEELQELLQSSCFSQKVIA